MGVEMRLLKAEGEILSTEELAPRVREIQKQLAGMNMGQLNDVATFILGDLLRMLPPRLAEAWLEMFNKRVREAMVFHDDKGKKGVIEGFEVSAPVEKSGGARHPA